MPEGDTIHRTAATLRRALVGGQLTRVHLPRTAPPLPGVGAEVLAVEARGKHLLVHTGDGMVVHTHQRMTGSWHLYAPGQAWRKPQRAARVVLAVPGRVAVCFHSPVVEVLRARELGRHPTLRRLGPDLCDPAADLDEALARMERLARLVGADRGRPLTIGEALLDQRVACGVGNVYRSEVLFLHGLAVSTPLRAVDPELRRELLMTSGRLLRANLGTTARTTVPGAAPGSLWVYGREGRPCRRCRSAIVRTELGDPPRVVDACPACQQLPTVDDATDRLDCLHER